MRHLWTNNVTSGTNTCEYIVLHHTGAVGDGNINACLYGGVSFHYLVRPDGSVVKFNEDDNILWHAGESKWDGKTGLNKYSIGVEIESDGKTYTDKQRLATKKLTESLMSKHNIPNERVIRHLDISGYRGKWDVSDPFWNELYSTWEEYQTSLQSLSEEKMEAERKADELQFNAAMKRMGEYWHTVPAEDRALFEDVNNAYRKVLEYLNMEEYK